MTCIAYKDGVLAGDGRVAGMKSGNILSDIDTKVFKLEKYLLGVAGDADAVEYLIEATTADHNPGKIKGAYGLRADMKGKVEIYEGNNWFRVSDKYAAIGVGDVLAMSAMDQGATAVEAVRAACKRNAFCGGKIRKVSF